MSDSPSNPLLVGVEEEFLLVDAETGAPTPRISDVMPKAAALAGDQAQEELHQAQIEHATTACDSLADLRSELVALRRSFVRAAASEGSLVVVSGTYPGRMGDEGRLITSKDRYQALAAANSILAREQLICGCHIHVSVPRPQSAINVMNRIRAWLTFVLALSANSPFWEAEDTGFSSYRTEVWARWPTSGPPGYFESHEEYQALLDQLVAAEVILDKKMAYWDVRPSENFPTVEIRVNDVMSRVDDVVALASPPVPGSRRRSKTTAGRSCGPPTGGRRAAAWRVTSCRPSTDRRNRPGRPSGTSSAESLPSSTNEVNAKR
jgi:glutamate---cysteine ligase / carboxylate-amine ligase